MQRSNTEQEEGGLYLTDQFVPWSQLSEVLKKSQIPLFSESSIAFAVTSWFLIIAIVAFASYEQINFSKVLKKLNSLD